MYRILNSRFKDAKYSADLERERVHPRDAFDRKKQSLGFQVFASKPEFVDDPLQFNTLTVATGTATRDDTRNLYNLSVGSSGDRVVRQSHVYLPYQIGAVRTAVCGCTLLTTSKPLTNYIVRVGVFDDRGDKTAGRISGDGYFFQLSGGVCSLVQRSYATGTQVDTVIPQSSWNNDALNGSGYSGYTLSLSTSTAVVVEDTCTDIGVVKMGFVIDGWIVWAHNFLPSSTTPNTTTCRLPIRYEISAVNGSGATASLYQTSCAAFIETGYLPLYRGIRLSYTMTTTARVSDGPVLTIRLKASANRATILPARISLFSMSGQGLLTAMVGRLLINATLTGATFASFSQTYSVAEIDTTATAYTGGTEVFSFLVSHSGMTEHILVDGFSGLGATIAGVADTLTLVVKSAAPGRVDMSASLVWIEDR